MKQSLLPQSFKLFMFGAICFVLGQQHMYMILYKYVPKIIELNIIHMFVVFGISIIIRIAAQWLSEE